MENGMLTVLDHVLILTACGLFFLLIVFLVFCKLHPRCWLHKRCAKGSDDAKSLKPSTGEQRMKNMQVAYGATNYTSNGKAGEKADGKAGVKADAKPDGRGAHIVTQTTFDTGSDAEEVIQLPKKRSERSSASSEDSGMFGMYRSVSSSSGSYTPAPLDSIQLSSFRDGSANFTLHYDGSTECLLVSGLGFKDLSSIHGHADQYMRVRIIKTPKFFSLRRKTSVTQDENGRWLDYDLRTSIKKDCIAAQYNDKLKFYIKHSELKYYTIRISLVDFDTYSRHVIAADTNVVLSTVSLPVNADVDFSEKLCLPGQENLGEVFISLSYLPISEKLYISVIRARDLKKPEKRKSLTSSFAKVSLMADGTQIRKYKTVPISNDPNPAYKETFSFDVPRDKMNTAYIMVAIATLESSETDQESLRSHILGRIYLGSTFEGVEKEHWMEMLQNPRKQITCWHKLS